MFDAELNRKILKFAPKNYLVKDFAPDTFESLQSNRTYGLVIYAGASDNTVYGDPAVNHAFRAWHDMLHLSLNADFSVEGEKRVGLEQAKLIDSDIMSKIILAEVNGQVEYLEQHGQFPANQLEFTLKYAGIRLERTIHEQSRSVS